MYDLYDAVFISCTHTVLRYECYLNKSYVFHLKPYVCLKIAFTKMGGFSDCKSERPWLPKRESVEIEFTEIDKFRSDKTQDQNFEIHILYIRILFHFAQKRIPE